MPTTRARDQERQREREQELPVDGSWRMVEGENDSFDTSILPETELDYDIPLSSGPSHISSQGQLSSIGASQESSHSIGDFVSRADDERVILRSPFRPSIPPTRQVSYEQNRSSEPEFHMPRMSVESPGGGSSARSSRTIRPTDGTAQRGLRRRQQTDSSYGSSPTKKRPAGGRSQRTSGHDQDDTELSLGGRISAAVPGAIVDILAWCFDIMGMALKMLKYPLAIGLALYMLFGGLIILQTMITQSFYASISPLCRIPGVGLLDLPFCPKFGETPAPAEAVEFDDLMVVQSSFEKVLERSAEGVSLPMEMKRSEMSVRDLKTVVRYSDLPHREELVLEFEQYIDTAKQTSSDLQKFNTHVGSAVDSVISINRWTSRYLDSLSAPESTSTGLEEYSTAGRLASWLFYPFQPAVMPIFDERALLDKYIEHTSMVSDRIAMLILEAQAVLRLLTKAEDNLSLIHEIVTRSHKDVKSTRDNVFWDLWKLTGGNFRRYNNLSSQLDLLKTVNAQRSEAVAQVSSLVYELERIQAGLGDLRDRVAEPSLVHDTVGGPGAAAIPLSVHIETIDRGVERLEDARHRIREAENAKVREVLGRGGVKQGDPLIEGRNVAA